MNYLRKSIYTKMYTIYIPSYIFCIFYLVWSNQTVYNDFRNMNKKKTIVLVCFIFSYQSYLPECTSSNIPVYYNWNCTLNLQLVNKYR